MVRRPFLYTRPTVKTERPFTGDTRIVLILVWGFILGWGYLFHSKYGDVVFCKLRFSESHIKLYRSTSLSTSKSNRAMPEINQSNDQLLQDIHNSQAKPTCSECGTYEPWGLSSWCPKCGYYPALGKCVGQTELEDQVEIKPQPQTVWEIIPEWGWILGFGTIAAIGLSIGARYYCSSAAELCLWTITQATVGFLMFMIAHMIVYLNAVSKSVEFGILSIFLTPLKIWGPTVRRFPAGAWKLDMAVWGLTLFISAFAIVGGFEFNSLFKDWGVRKSANVNLVATIVDQAKNAEGDGADNLEEALDDFAGGSEETPDKMAEKAAAAAGAAGGALPEPEPEKEPEETATAPLQEYDCLLLGYSALPNGKIDSVLIASSYNKKLVYAGYIIGSDLPEDIRKEWESRLPELRQKKPFVKNKQVATWIKPRITLKVAAEGWNEHSRRLIKPQFVSLLQEISVD